MRMRIDIGRHGTGFGGTGGCSGFGIRGIDSLAIAVFMIVVCKITKV
jgi:hypothetical protein